MKHFTKNVNALKLLTIFAKLFILNIRQKSEYAAN